MKDFRRTPKSMVRLPLCRPAKVGKENAEPDADEEDDVSFQRHIKVLQQEYKKSKPNLQIGAELMAATFRRRHTEIQDRPTPVVSILLKFPFLQCYEEVQ